MSESGVNAMTAESDALSCIVARVGVEDFIRVIPATLTVGMFIDRDLGAKSPSQATSWRFHHISSGFHRPKVENFNHLRIYIYMTH